ncbi:hypothetical protein Z517_02873 [Fonsecaea pedrosoi CBS 271.37]|uniref:Short-chain dehydrogenase/reductase 3 n=1 Tax=Fonsecaea pedrosoi CBS 271.37 TaxID=1442368 RepID=A0A0D2FAF4_9EURO|nr:uncharacterized protein Z517_02873 [Fonsecaea pedrosoi CBS 271.37]KIW83627.1 hypothetical protein Z517_02873 [Fonsecaea pedrosoi CBS 271.37]
MSWILSNLALNGWSWSKKGEPWDFSGTKEIVVVTGGCSGFGKLMVERFAGRAKIVILDVSPLPKDLQSVPNLKYYRCDLTNRNEVGEIGASIKADVGDPSILINNAGISNTAPILKSPLEVVEKMFKVNLLCHWQTVQEFLPNMLKNKKGHIVTIASMASFISMPGSSDYCSSKAALVAFHEVLTQECRHGYENGDCIQLTIVHPSFASTPILRGHEGELRKMGASVMDPSVVADAVVNQVFRGRSGRLIVPSSFSLLSFIRGWPIWLQEIFRNHLSRNMMRFRKNVGA